VASVSKIYISIGVISLFTCLSHSMHKELLDKKNSYLGQEMEEAAYVACYLYL
jgi:hypothetical protein